MPHQDQGRSPAAVLAGLVTPGMFGSMAFRPQCRWTPTTLVRAVLVWAWGKPAALTDRFADALEVTTRSAAKQDEFSVSYQAFLKLLKRHSAVLLSALLAALRERMQRALAAHYLTAERIAFGVDGTRIDAPRTEANELAFGSQLTPRRGRRRRRADRKKAAAPQIRLTALWHVGTGLPWAWNTARGAVGEREQLLGMLDRLPPESLLLGDAGFVGYDFWNAIAAAGHDFLIRVGANVRLLSKLGYYREGERRVYVWPDAAARDLRPPLVLRLVIAQGGKHPVYLVTSVLDPHQLSDRQLVELYRARWGVELFFRDFKRTFSRHKLRAATPDNALLELDWSLAAFWAACLEAKRRRLAAGEDILRTSTAGVLRIVRRALYAVKLPLKRLFAAATIDDYLRRDKTSRDYPRKKNEAPTTDPPLLKLADQKQVKLAYVVKRLTA
jgi:hypothetical protein